MPTPDPLPCPLVLASTSPFRRTLLERLGLPFTTLAPEVDETPLPGEPASELVQRLARLKAAAGAAAQPGPALVIGSDQVAVLDGEILGKPGNRERAQRQLTRLSGREVEFLTGLCLHHAGSGRMQLAVVPFRVGFRELTPDEIGRYLERERPFGCAGSFRSEALGISLFRYLRGDDPTALIGLPLIRLAEMLRAEGVTLP